MTGKAFSARRFRTILDCSLILLLILMALSNQPAIQAKFGSQPVLRDAYAFEPASSPSWQAAGKAPANTGVPAELAHQDDNTLAAMIAAENAALTELSALSTYLPVVIR